MLASFCMTAIVPLRVFGASNILFIVYGFLGHIYPVLFLHMVLLPVNLARLRQLQAPTRDGPRAPLPASQN